MARTVLLDTGVLVALVDPRDPDHAACLEAWSTLRARLISTEGVLVEAAHLLRYRPGGIEAAARIVRGAGVEFAPMTPEGMDRAIDLVGRYRNVPMDLVDGLLVTAAEEYGTGEILTLDRRGFETYRYGRRRAFSILPA